LEWVRDRIGWNNSDDFGRQRMSEYLRPDGHPQHGRPDHQDFDPQGIADPDNFPPQRIFCIVGTNARDYEAAMGMSRGMVGPQSDGLVQTDSAWVRDAHAAWIHRAHSGRYGMVNSEEGYHNLRRFLFGDLQVAASLDGLDPARSSQRAQDAAFQIEVRVAVRGQPTLMHERLAANHSPMPFANADESVHLFTTFLLTRGDPARYAVTLNIIEIRQVANALDLTGHLEQVPLWSDTLVVEIPASAERERLMHYTWRSAATEPTTAVRLGVDALLVHLPLPAAACLLLGDQAGVTLRTTPHG
jgi:hypothetical protein